MEKVKDTVIDKLISAPLEELDKWAADKPKAQIEATMDQLRVNMKFYKNILNEDFHAKNPKSLRYDDANNKVDKINKIGLKLKEILTLKTN